MKRVLILSLVLALVLAFGSMVAAAPIKSVMVTDVGGLGDQSFNDAAWRGLCRAEEELGASVGVVESSMMTDYEPNLSNLAESGADLIWAVGFLMTDAVDNIAPLYPDIKFGLIDAVVDHPNVASFTFKDHEASYLAGVFAALWSKTGKIGFIGGMDVPVIERFESGFRAGVKDTNPDAEILIGYAGNFNDPGKGKELALTQYNQGADIIYHAAGATGLGLIEAAKEVDKFAIGVDSDQTVLDPEHVVASMLKRVDNAVFTGVKDLIEGQFVATHRELGLAEGGVGLAYSKGIEIPASIVEKIAEVEQAIIDGTIVVPGTRAEL
ncbi:MAG: BMP family ABC transporter substrate-binding protein [Firmicutes bacterium]|nr:BMP family ABC transporter substrate-binding protein [Bacillota bacterium]